jgi:hypothetical protein
MKGCEEMHLRVSDFELWISTEVIIRTIELLVLIRTCECL